MTEGLREIMEWRAPKLLQKRNLLLEEVLEGLAGVVGASWRRRSGNVGGAGLHVRGGRRVFLHGHAEFVELAIILDVFGRDAFGDGLSTLELRTAVKEAALLAAVQFEVALGALAVGVEAGSEDGSAIGAASAGDGADHARGARAELIHAAWAASGGLTLTLLSFFAFF